MLSEAQVAQYHEAGYVVPEFRLSRADLVEIKAAHDRLLARRPEYRDYCPAITTDFPRKTAAFRLHSVELAPELAP
jgi:hypothetical protein